MSKENSVMDCMAVVLLVLVFYLCCLSKSQTPVRSPDERQQYGNGVVLNYKSTNDYSHANRLATYCKSIPFLREAMTPVPTLSDFLYLFSGVKSYIYYTTADDTT